MAESISILDVVKRGGFEASLITTFNATLPFYEEFVLRRLIAAGSRYNVVMMDAKQCAQAWASESARPRLAGHAYTLVPMRTAGAFHPKVCLLAGPKKASILIGSHNLTLSGFGYNHEITNWIEVGGGQDVEGVNALADVWGLIEQWISQQRMTLPEPIINSVLALSGFLAPLTQKAKGLGVSGVLGQSTGRRSLLGQVADRIPGRVLRIVVVGAFFDATCAFLREVERRWPEAEIVVLIDIETVHFVSDVAGLRSRFVDARVVWADAKMNYLHAKAMYFETDIDGVLVSGSANPSWPAWMAGAENGNVEAVFLRSGREAFEAAESLGLPKAFAWEALDVTVLRQIADRSKAETTQPDSDVEIVCVAVAEVETDLIALSPPVGFEPTSVAAFGSGEVEFVITKFTIEDSGQLRIWLDVPISQVRSIIVRRLHGASLRAIVHHTTILKGLSHTKRQAILREALGALSSGEGDVARLIAAVEKVIFSEEIGNEVRTFSRTAKKDDLATALPSRPDTLGIHVADLPMHRKKLRLLKSGDLGYLLDVLIRRLGFESEQPAGGKDARGRSEEESVGQDDETSPEPATDVLGLDDIQIAGIVAGKARTLVRRMVAQLDAAAKDEAKSGVAIAQLVAVIGLIRELRRLRLAPRWRLKQSFVNEVDRRTLLDKSMAWLFGRNSMALPKLLDAADGPLEEVSYLRALLLWLAWDLGEELTDRINPMLEADELMGRIRTNAILFELLPSAAADPEELAELERSIRMTVAPTGEEAARAAVWLDRHLTVGKQVQEVSFSTSLFAAEMRVGKLATVPGTKPPLCRVVTGLVGDQFSIWDFDGVRSFVRRAAD